MNSELTNTLLKDLDYMYDKYEELVNERDNGYNARREELIETLAMRISFILDTLWTAYQLNEIEEKKWNIHLNK